MNRLLSLIINEKSKLPSFERAGENCIQTRIKSREWYNESSSFSNNLMKRQSFAREGGGD